MTMNPTACSRSKISSPNPPTSAPPKSASASVRMNFSSTSTTLGLASGRAFHLPDENPGLVHPLKDWTKISIAQIPMGQGIAVTPLQMVMAMSAIANKGILMRPMLVNHLEDAEGKVVAQYQPQAVRHVAGPDASLNIITALKTVATRDGTAVAAHLDHYTVAGKTGTAQKVEAGTLCGEVFLVVHRIFSR